MAEFLTMDEAKSKFGSKSRTNAGLSLTKLMLKDTLMLAAASLKLIC